MARKDIAGSAHVNLLRAELLSADLPVLLDTATNLRDAGHGRLQSYSPKVFLPLTKLCRDYCHYCTFSRQRTGTQQAFLKPDEVLSIAQAGKKAGCTEALFTLGDKPELRYAVARKELDQLGHSTTVSYLREMCRRVLDEIGLLPHINAGVMTKADMAELRSVSVSQGLMLESIADRLCEKGGPHYRSPDKLPAVRLQNIRQAGELSIPFTSGILIGIGETRDERIDALIALHDLHRRYGHIQEVIVQNFRAKQRTPMADWPEPSLEELLWTIAVARIIFGTKMNIQAPPNLSRDSLRRLISAGINDWGGISPVTQDHVNPEAPWPEVEKLRESSAQEGRILVKRLPLYPAYCQDIGRWVDANLAAQVRRASDASGYSRDDSWCPGKSSQPDFRRSSATLEFSSRIEEIVQRASSGEALDESEIVMLFEAHDVDVEGICAAADLLRQKVCGDVVTYVVNRNINYTNICKYSCGFCAFSKGTTQESLRGRPYDLGLEEVVRRTKEAHARGATEVCLQGGIHPRYTGETYISLCRAIREATPGIHIHAFSPLEVAQGAESLGLPVERFLKQLKKEGLNTLPGTAAEILDDDVRAVICPDKLNTEQWLNVVETAHRAGFKTTATIMFGHIEQSKHWARHLLRIRDLQRRTGGITEFVPLPFVHMEAPIALRGKTRIGPTLREVRLMHAVSRLVLHPLITNIQLSWVKLGPEVAQVCLNGGVNDIGGTLMNESISRAAGTQHGQELAPEKMEALILSAGRVPAQRTTTYGPVSATQRLKAAKAPPLAAVIQTPPKKHKYPKKSESCRTKING